MTANPWDKFYWNDWENDPALKLCSLAAQGLWMRMLCICAKADPKGYLLVAGQPLSPFDLASLVGKPESEVETLLTELSGKGVLSRDRKSRIYSRRMVRDVLKASIARQHGQRGGNPTLCNDKGNRASDNPPNKPPDKPHKPVTSDLSNDKSDIRPKPRASYPAAFEDFWKAYPTDKLMSKTKAFAAFSRLPQDDREMLMQSVPAFCAYCVAHPDYRAVHAVRYITERRFEGFAELSAQASSKVYVRRGSPQWAAWEADYRKRRGISPPTDSNNGWWFPSEYPPQSVAA